MVRADRAVVRHVGDDVELLRCPNMDSNRKNDSNSTSTSTSNSNVNVELLLLICRVMMSYCVSG